MTLGLMKNCINPEYPVYMAGFSFRKTLTEVIDSPIFLRVAIFNSQIALIQADIIWWHPSLISAICKKIAANPLISQLECIFHATHSHGSPTISSPGADDPKLFSELLGKDNPVYAEFLLNKCYQTLIAAYNNSEKIITVSTGTTKCDFVINRRRKGPDGKVVMGPNPEGILYDDVTVIHVSTENAHLTMCHLSCHPTISATFAIIGEFPGYIEQQLEEDGCIAMVLQGYCGDLRPNLSKNGEFFRGEFHHVQDLGAQLLHSIQSCCNKLESLEVENHNLKFYQKTFCFPLEAIPPLATLEEWRAKSQPGTIEREWLEHLCSRYETLTPHIEIPIHSFSFNSFIFVGVAAELVCAYQFFLKRKYPGRKVLGLGYTNGAVGYIPTKEQLREGGYESDISFRYFLMNQKFTAEVEGLLQKALTEAVEQLCP